MAYKLSKKEILAEIVKCGKDLTFYQQLCEDLTPNPRDCPVQDIRSKPNYKWFQRLSFQHHFERSSVGYFYHYCCLCVLDDAFHKDKNIRYATSSNSSKLGQESQSNHQKPTRLDADSNHLYWQQGFLRLNNGFKSKPLQLLVMLVVPKPCLSLLLTRLHVEAWRTLDRSLSYSINRGSLYRSIYPKRCRKLVPPNTPMLKQVSMTFSNSFTLGRSPWPDKNGSRKKQRICPNAKLLKSTNAPQYVWWNCYSPRNGENKANNGTKV